MKKRVKWTACLIMLLCVMCMGAAAETAYESLCLQHGIAGNEVIAWLEIPGASICTPVMRHPKEDAYYAKHAPHGGDCTPVFPRHGNTSSPPMQFLSNIPDLRYMYTFRQTLLYHL